MGGAVSAGEDNEELVDNLVEADYVKTVTVEKALRAVDRGCYYLEGYQDVAYKDLAWKSGNLHMSAPCIYSEVLECLKITPGLSFLNLGSGTGYLSTVAGLLLGTYGLNHGVEQHRDVVEYANMKLKEFMLKSTSIDLMDFCVPKFVVGDCLQLDPSCSVQAYDRVYCGAAVPPEYVDYIKNLVKVGGVVVMPCGEQLLQFVRTGATSWESKNVMRVSFASLVEPSAEDRFSPQLVVLPERIPLRLQDDESDQPYQSDDGESVAEANNEDADASAAAAAAARQRVRRQIIAVGTAGVSRRPGGRWRMSGLRLNHFYLGEAAHDRGSDAEPAAAYDVNSEDEPEPESEPRPEPDEESEPPPADNDPSQRDGEDDEQNCAEDTRDMLDREQQILLGVDDWRSNDDSRFSMNSTNTAEMNELTDDNAPMGNVDDGISNQSTAGSQERSAPNGGANSTSESSKRCHSESEVPEAERRRKRVAPRFPRHVRCMHPQDSDTSDGESAAYQSEQRKKRQEQAALQQKLSQSMIQRIGSLPLPHPMKSFLNYYRD